MSHQIKNFAPVGSLLKKKTKKKKSDKGRVKDNAHLDFIRQLPCVISGKWPVDAAHVRYADLDRGKDYTGKGVKPSDKWVLPLHRDIHSKQHSMSERKFWEGLGIDPLNLCEELYRISGDLEAGRRLINEARLQIMN